MFELKYNITDGDFRAENKRIMWFYFALYAAVAAVGLAIGIVAVVLDPQKLMYVLGIVLLVLSGILALCALFLLIAPKNYAISAIETSEEPHDVLIDKHGITVDGENIYAFADIIRIKRRKTGLFAYVSKDRAFLVKNTLGEDKFNELVAYMTERKGRILLSEQTVGEPDDTPDTNETDAQE